LNLAGAEIATANHIAPFHLQLYFRRLHSIQRPWRHSMEHPGRSQMVPRTDQWETRSLGYWR